MRKCEGLKNEKIGKSAAKPRTEEGSTTSKTYFIGIGLQAIGNLKR